MIDMSKPFVWQEGHTVIGYDPGCPEGDRACKVTMVHDPKTGVMTVIKIEHWSHDDKEKRAEALRVFAGTYGSVDAVEPDSFLRIASPTLVDDSTTG